MEFFLQRMRVIYEVDKRKGVTQRDKKCKKKGADDRKVYKEEKSWNGEEKKRVKDKSKFGEEGD